MATITSNPIIANLDPERTSRLDSLDEDFFIIDNPSFRFNHHHPYRSPMVMAIYCRRGSAGGRVNMVEYRMSSDNFLIIFSNQILESTYVSDDFEGSYILMSEHFLEGLNIDNGFFLIDSISSNPCFALNERMRESIDSYMAMCRNIIAVEDNPHRLEMIQLITQAFFLGFGHFVHLSLLEQQPSTLFGSELMARFVQLVERNYRHHRDVEFYAEQLNLSPKYLSRAIKSVSGRKALSWIERYVVLDAKSQLASTTDSIKHIAYNLNFPSQSFFGKYFTRVVGLSPLQYRRSVSRSAPMLSDSTILDNN